MFLMHENNPATGIPMKRTRRIKDLEFFQQPAQHSSFTYAGVITRGHMNRSPDFEANARI
jgi:hypothetical protein